MDTNRKKWLLVIAFVASAVLTAVFAFRAVHRRPHPNRDEQIRPWMTITYVAHSYHVAPHILYDALGIQHKPHDRLTVARVAREQNRPIHAVISDLMEAIDRARPRPDGSPLEPLHPRGSPSQPAHPNGMLREPGYSRGSSLEPVNGGGRPPTSAQGHGSPSSFPHKPELESGATRGTL
jgi:hypothetical protein